MNTSIENKQELLESMPQELQGIASKVINRQRLSFEEGLLLFNTEYDLSLKDLADYSRKQNVGDNVYFQTTLFIHPTNLCELSCPMCSFYAKPGWDTAWFLTPKQIEEKVRKNLDKGITELHFVGGLWRECNLDYYKETFSRIKSLDPSLHIKALTPVEYDFLAKHHDISIEEVFKRMIDWGLESLPGGGAEILVENIRQQVAPSKISSDEYLSIHKTAHQQGLPSNITMLFGHVEDPEHIITHLCRVRELQDETQGFRTFVPLKYSDENNALGKRKKRLKPKDLKRIYAVSRLMLDNLYNIKVLWNYVGIDEAQELLQWGANDLGSTAIEEKIITMAGGIKVQMTPETMKTIIHQANRSPKPIHSGYDYTQDQPWRYALEQ